MAKSSEKPAVYVLKRDGGLFGEFEMDQEAINSLPNSRIKVTLTTGRSPSRLRWYWAFLREVITATECCLDTESLHSLIKLNVGLVTPVMMKGFTVMVPKSVSFSSMDEENFSNFCNAAVKFIAETYGVVPQDKGE